MDGIFEKASREQLRYKVSNGTITTEDLWDVSLEFLDKLAKSLNKEIKEAEEESFIKAKTTANKTLDLKFEVVKHIITIKLEEQEAKKARAEKAAKKAQLLELIGRKEVASLENKTIDELKAELEAL